ncbi:MAG: hypothetical protein O2890_01940 [Cyanobacteria bacterium]|nr:hypothetical protein [Cyanobacteriota bacterium]MDA0865179.1 hypothetical protein [Cyanobacteriota bacterium]
MQDFIPRPAGDLFVYSWIIGGFKSSNHIAMMDVQSQKAAAEQQPTGRMRVIVQDNGSMHPKAKSQSFVYLDVF